MTPETVARAQLFSRWIWLMPLLIGFAIFEALQPVGNPAEQMVWYSVLVIFATAGLTRVCRAQRKFDLFEPLHMVFAIFVIFYPVRALFAVWLDDSWFDPSKSLIWTGLSASVLGFVCFALGYKIGSRKLGGPRTTWLDQRWDIKRANAVSLAFLIIGFAGFVAVRLLGGTFFYYILLDPDIKAPGEISAWFFYLLWVCIFMQVGAVVQLGVWISTGRRVLWTIVYCGLALFSTFLLARLFTVFFLIVLMLSWHYRRRRIRIFQLAMLVLLIVSYLGIAGLYREWISPGNTLEQTGELAQLAGQQDTLVLKYVVANLEELSNLSEVISITPSRLPYQFGATFTPILFKPIPRAIMPSKPLGASALFTRELFPESYDSGLVTGLGAWGEWYLNFSWPGLVLGMALSGALTAFAYNTLRVTGGFAGMLLYSSFILVLFSWLRSDFNSATTYGLYYFIPAVAALAYIAKTNPDTRQSRNQTIDPRPVG